jgi:DNA-binding SARP family transcriptional activator
MRDAVPTPASIRRIATYDEAVLEVRLLGVLEAHARKRLLPAPAHPQGAALLAWLALHPGEHPRGPLAALLWPELAPSNARTSLRSAAWSVRRMLGPDERDVHDGRATLGLHCTTDVQAFGRLVEEGEHAAALALCRGPLLDGLDEHAWVLAARAEHAARVDAARARLPVR